MKKNKGFTLIELLAVIVILAIIALIATPIITGQLDQIRSSAFLRSANSIVHAAELKYATGRNEATEPSANYDVVYANSSLVGTNSINYKGARPDDGLISIDPYGKILIALWNDTLKKCAVKGYDEDEAKYVNGISNKTTCTALTSSTVVLLYEQVIDTNPGVICGTGLTEDYDGNSVCNINSVEDLVAFSSLAKTQTFSWKTISLNTNLDIADDVSYINPATISLGNINGDGLTEGLKIELGKANGFYPIGSTSSQFFGTFEGNGHIINNIMIKGTTNVGLFGYAINAKAKNLFLDNISVTGTGDNVGSLLGSGYLAANAITITNATVNGGNNTGGLAGNSICNINSSVIVKANVTGLNNTGGIVGKLEGVYYSCSGNINSAVYEGNVNGTASVGGIVGYVDSYSTASGSIIKGGAIVGTSSVGRIIGSGTAPSTSIALNTVTVNGATVISTSFTSVHGYDVTSAMLNDINTYESAVDTYIGGDNNTDGYYFDYGTGTNIVIKPASALAFTLTGAGTAGDPYLINNAAELKQVSLRLGSYFKLVSDINLTGTHSYMLSSFSNQFSGNFDGNGKTISNFSVKGIQYLGLFGYAYNGTAKNLVLDNISVTGTGENVGGVLGYGYLAITGVNITNAIISGGDNTGGLIGYAMCKTNSSVFVKGNITGLNNTGGIVGKLEGVYYSCTGTITSAIYEGNVTGTASVGGIVGNSASYSNTTGSINKGGTVAGTSSVGRIIGSGVAPSTSIALNTLTVNGAAVTSTSFTSIDGYDVTAAMLNDINTYESAVDTYIGGDNNTDGYYFDYGTGNNIVIKPVSALAFTLTGAGSAGDPYLINNAAELKQVSLRPGSYFKLVSDINLTGTDSYMLSSYGNQFTGTLDGNGKTISNFSIKGIQNVGLFGYAGYGNVKNLMLDNISVTGTGDNVGGLFGNGYLSAKGITITNAIISGGNYTGGLAGYSICNSISSVIVKGNVTGLSNTGGIAGKTEGYAYSCGGTVTSAIYEGNVAGTASVGGIVGNATTYSNTTGTFNKGGSITGTSSVGRIVGSWVAPNNAIALNTILVNGSAVTSTSFVSIDGYDVTAAILNDINTYESVVDTYIGGDNDNDGYYFDYGTGTNIIIKPASALAFTLAGGGSVGDPYLINNAAELKQVSLRSGSYFKLVSDINLTGTNSYMLSSYSNQFTGIFDGNGKVISNFSIKGIQYVGLFGYTGYGTAKNLILDNISVTGIGDSVGGLFGNGYMAANGITITNATISGGNYTGGLAGYSMCNTISSVIVKGNVIGLSNTGGIAGKTEGYAYSCGGTVTSALYEGNVTGAASVSGIVGNATSYSNTYNIVNKGGTITGTSSVGRIIGSWVAPSNAIALNTILVNGALASPTGISTANGQDTTAANLLSQATYTAIGLNFTDNTPGLYIWHISGSNIWITLN